MARQMIQSHEDTFDSFTCSSFMHILLTQHPIFHVISCNPAPSIVLAKENDMNHVASLTTVLSSTATCGIGLSSVVHLPVNAKGVGQVNLEKRSHVNQKAPVTEKQMGLFKYFTEIDHDQLREQNHKLELKRQEYRQCEKETEAHRNLEKAEKKQAGARL
jgi:hypothetical protein